MITYTHMYTHITHGDDMKKTHRINLNLELETLEVIDAFAKMNNRSRTYVIEELLKPSLPALRELLKLSGELEEMSDVERLAALAKLSRTEEKLTNLGRNLPDHVRKITEG